MKFSLCIALLFSFLGTSTWASEEYCGQLAYLSDGLPSQKGFYLRTKEMTAQIVHSTDLNMVAQLKTSMKQQGKQIGSCLIGSLTDAPAGSPKKDLKLLSDVTAVRNYFNGNMPDSIGILKLNIDYEGVWPIDPRTGEMNIYTDAVGAITDITFEIREPIKNELKNWDLVTIKVSELLSGKEVGIPSDFDDPILKIKAAQNFGVFGGDLKLTYITESGTESQIITVKRIASTGKYQIEKSGNLIQKISFVTRGLTESSGYVSSFKLN
jgi:hypothetical protein